MPEYRRYSSSKRLAVAADQASVQLHVLDGHVLHGPYPPRPRADILRGMHRVVLYTRAGCHLCDVARDGPRATSGRPTRSS